MLHFEGRFQVGDVIKAYDFEPLEGRPEIYVIGKIKKIGRCQHGYEAFFIECSFDSGVDDQLSEYSRVSETILVPVGVRRDYDNRVSIYQKS